MPYNSLADLPPYVKRRSKKEQAKWMSVWNDEFKNSGNETEAFKRANGALSLAIPWSDMRAAAKDDQKYEIVECFVSDVFPDWEPSGVYQVQVMRSGLWKGHPEYGDILIQNSDLVDAVKNFRGASRKPFLDDDHGITHPELSTHPGQSFGWMRDMWIEDFDGKRLEVDAAAASTDKVLFLKAEYEVNEEGNGWLKDKTKALYSPTFWPAYYNKETGELQGMTIVGGAMTNTPYFDGMQGFAAVAASSRYDGKELASATFLDETEKVNEQGDIEKRIEELKENEKEKGPVKSAELEQWERDNRTLKVRVSIEN